MGFDYSSQEYFTSIMESFSKTVTGVKSSYHSVFTYSCFEIWIKCCSNSYWGLCDLFIIWQQNGKTLSNVSRWCRILWPSPHKKQWSTKLLKWSQKEYFYFSVLWNPQFLCTNNGFTALKLVTNNFWLLNYDWKNDNNKCSTT